MLNVYLSGEIHTDWRDEIINKCNQEGLEIKFSSPVTNHELSDNCGVQILGACILGGRRTGGISNNR